MYWARRSVGEMLEADEAEQYEKTPSRGKLAKTSPGRVVVYKGRLPKTLEVGRVVSVLRAEGAIIVHCYKPVSDGRLRLMWRPKYLARCGEVLQAVAEEEKQQRQRQLQFRGCGGCFRSRARGQHCGSLTDALGQALSG